MATIFEFICYHVCVAGWLRNGRSEQSGQLRQQAQEPYMSGKVQTMCRSDYIATCPEKKVQNSVSVKNGTNFHLFTKWRIHNSPKPSRRLQHHATGYPSMWWRDHGWKALKIFDGQKCICAVPRWRPGLYFPYTEFHTFFTGQVPISSDIHVVQTFPDMSGARPSCRSWSDCSLRPFP